MYQLRKTVSRHKAGFGFAATVFLLLAALAVTMSVQSVRIAEERDRTAVEASKAMAVNSFIQEMLGSANPYEGLGQEVTVIETLDEAVKRIEGSLRNQPDVEAAVRNTIGRTYLALGRHETAEYRAMLAESEGPN
jgi:hypothetical protein